MTWIGEVATIVGSAASVSAVVFGLLNRRANAINGRIDGAYVAIDAAKKELGDGLSRARSDFGASLDVAKREASEALMAHSLRTDSRHEAVRQELNNNVQLINGRIDRIADSMVRKDDMEAWASALSAQMSSLASRIDRVLEVRGAGK